MVENKDVYLQTLFSVVQDVLVTADECKCGQNVCVTHSAHKNICDQGSLINIGMSNAFCSALHQAHEKHTVQQTKDLSPQCGFKNY